MKDETLKCIDKLLQNKFLMSLKNLLEIKDFNRDLILKLLTYEIRESIPGDIDCCFFNDEGEPIIRLLKKGNNIKLEDITINNKLRLFLRSITSDTKGWKIYEEFNLYARYTPGTVTTVDTKSDPKYKNSYLEGFNQGIIGNKGYIEDLNFLTQYPNPSKDGVEDGFDYGYSIYTNNNLSKDYKDGANYGFSDGFYNTVDDLSDKSEEYINGYTKEFDNGYNVATY